MESVAGRNLQLEIAEAAYAELSHLDDRRRGPGTHSLRCPTQPLSSRWPWNPPASTVADCYSPGRVDTIRSIGARGAELFHRSLAKSACPAQAGWHNDHLRSFSTWTCKGSGNAPSPCDPIPVCAIQNSSCCRCCSLRPIAIGAFYEPPLWITRS